MSVSTNDLKNGMTLELDGTLFQVIEFQHVKPGKGGAFVRTKLRNVRTGAVVERYLGLTLPKAYQRPSSPRTTTGSAKVSANPAEIGLR